MILDTSDKKKEHFPIFSWIFGLVVLPIGVLLITNIQSWRFGMVCMVVLMGVSIVVFMLEGTNKAGNDLKAVLIFVGCMSAALLIVLALGYLFPGYPFVR